MKILLIFTLLAGIAIANAGQPAILGHLETKDRVITIWAGEQPRYTVCAKNGKVLAERISLRELNAKFPELRRTVDGSYASWAGM